MKIWPLSFTLLCNLADLQLIISFPLSCLDVKAAKKQPPYNFSQIFSRLADTVRSSHIWAKESSLNANVWWIARNIHRSALIPLYPIVWNFSHNSGVRNNIRERVLSLVTSVAILFPAGNTSRLESPVLPRFFFAELYAQMSSSQASFQTKPTEVATFWYTWRLKLVRRVSERQGKKVDKNIPYHTGLLDIYLWKKKFTDTVLVTVHCGLIVFYLQFIKLSLKESWWQADLKF